MKKHMRRLKDNFSQFIKSHINMYINMFFGQTINWNKIPPEPTIQCRKILVYVSTCCICWYVTLPQSRKEITLWILHVCRLISVGSFQPNSTGVRNWCSQIFYEFLPFNCFSKGSISWKFQLHNQFSLIL